MEAVVLVGGFGTRLRPLTLTRPKQMLPIVDRPMIEHVLGWLAANNVDRAVLALGYRPDVFIDAYPSGVIAGVRVVYAVEDSPLDTAGAIRFAALTGGVEDTFLAVNGDVLTDLDVAELLSVHEAAGALGTLHLAEVDDPSRYGVVPLAPDGRVLEFVEKPPAESAPSRWINAGTYVLEREVIDRIPADRPVSIERETFPALAGEGRLYGVESVAYWIDTGTPATYIAAQVDLCSGRRQTQLAGVHPEAIVHPDALVIDSVVMARARVEAGAVVEHSVVSFGAVVGASAVVSESILGVDAQVEAGAFVRDLTVLGDGVLVARGESLHAQRRPSDPPT